MNQKWTRAICTVLTSALVFTGPAVEGTTFSGYINKMCIRDRYTVGNALTKGGATVKLSALVMGLANMAHKQIIKGLIFLAIETVSYTHLDVYKRQIDMYTGELELAKTGAAPSFIKSGKKVWENDYFKFTWRDGFANQWFYFG